MKRRAALWIAAGAGVVLLLLAAGIGVLTMTDFGRERVRLFGLGELESRIQGQAEIARVRGNLLTGATLEGVSIRDREGRPFLSADTVSLRYSIRSLFQKHLVLSDVRLVRPVVVLDQPPGGTWNVERIFRGDTAPAPGDTVPGFGDWVRIEDLTVVDGDVTVKREWTPEAGQSDRPVAEAVPAEEREMVASAPGGGFQSISRFHRVHGEFPFLRLADPDSAARVVEIDSLSMLALPFRPPAVRIRDLEGRFTITDQTLGLHDVGVLLPDSRLRIDGSYAFSGPERVSVQVRGDPVALSDLRWLRPSLPEGGGEFEVTVTRDADRTLLAAREMDLGAEGGRLQGFAEVEINRSGIRLERSDVRFEGVDTRTIRRLGGVELPVDGILAGHVRLAGTAEELDVDGRGTIRERTGATSVVHADGVVLNGAEGVVAQDLRLRFDPVQLTLARSVRPDVPLRGAVTGRALLNGPLSSMFAVDADLVHQDPGTGRSRVLARGDVQVEGGVRARDLDVTLDPLQSGLARSFDPDFPLRGTVTGRVTVDGDLESIFAVDADLVHDADGTGPSRLAAAGGLRLADGLAARNLRVRMDPLRIALVRDLDPDLPLDGTLEGRATLDGAVATRIEARDVDVTHRGSTGTSALAGGMALSLADGIRAFDVDLRAEPLSLATVGLFAPGAGLRGSGIATIVASGTPDRATLRTALEVAGGGTVTARGTVGVGPAARYDLETQLTRFDASAVTRRAPPTTLTGSVDVAGVGTELATARARVDATLVDSEIDGTPRTDSTRVRARLDEGLAVVEEGRIRLASARADVEGSFGLVGGRRGELRYAVIVDSLSRFAGLLPPADTGAVAPRPLPRSREIAAARADSVRVAEDQLVESMATGRPPPPPPALDTAPPLPRDSVSGSLHAEGVLTGNVEAFDLRGTAELEEVVLQGASVGSGTADYELLDAPDPEAATVTLDAELDRVRVDGFAFSEATARLEHLGRPRSGSGQLEIDLVQDDARDYEIRADYDLERTELRLDRVLLRFDTTRWASTRPGIVRWAGEGVELDHVELANQRGGRIFADGRLPDEEPGGSLSVEVESLQIGHLAALLQDTVDTRGLLSLDATVTGSLRAPLLEGNLAVDSLQRRGERIPAVRSSFAYADRELTARAEVLGEDRTLLEGDARIPVDLALRGRDGPRLLEGPVFADLRLDSLALEVLPLPTDQVSDVRGRLGGDLSVRGSVEEPELEGDVELHLASAHLVEPGISLRDGFGAFRLRDRRVHVDSVVVHSGGGPVRVVGTVDMETLDRPELALDLTARDAVALDSEGDRLRVDLDLDVQGPIQELAVVGDARVRGGEIQVPDPEQNRRVTRLDDPVIVDVLDTLEVAPQLRPGSPLLERVRADVTVRIDRDTWLRNPDLSLEVYTPSGQPPLRLRTDPDTRSFSILGTVHTDRGEYTFGGRQLELNSGSVTFLGEPDPDPLLQLHAQHEVPRRGRETLVILITVGGYLSEPHLTLSSNQEPPLPESDLLSYLAFGRSSSSLLGAEGSGLMGDALGGLGVLAERQLAGLGLGALTDAFVTGLERRGAAAGLDLFRVHPGVVPDELNYSGYFGNLLRGTEVEAGEYIGERLFVLARTRPVEQAIPGLEVEYRTPGGFSWITTWDLRYMPRLPALGLQEVSRTRTFGSFLLWTRRW